MNRGRKRRRGGSEDSEEGTNIFSRKKKTVESDEVEDNFSLENVLLRSQIQGLQADMLNTQMELADAKTQLVQCSELIEELQDQADLLERRAVECSGEAGLLQNQVNALKRLTHEMELTHSRQVFDTLPAQFPDVNTNSSLIQNGVSATPLLAKVDDVIESGINIPDNDDSVSTSLSCPTIEYHANLMNRYHALCPSPPQWFSRAFLFVNRDFGPQYAALLCSWIDFEQFHEWKNPLRGFHPWNRPVLLSDWMSNRMGPVPALCTVELVTRFATSSCSPVPPMYWSLSRLRGAILVNTHDGVEFNIGGEEFVVAADPPTSESGKLVLEDGDGPLES
ncbi:hypothetical protein BDP27DRAFT_1428285 [Rhodocollybia butyracea]|uniref:Uncharacterized protein n=1 Tax=Rhodocollybia butyracea TaxID=206335 RepID=A0A9P5PEW5_9AGAR|nr:hypothetical protein BDP27DRAFT_1428285 [Rhodocollybia butyracea]